MCVESVRHSQSLSHENDDSKQKIKFWSQPPPARYPSHQRVILLFSSTAGPPLASAAGPPLSK